MFCDKAKEWCVSGTGALQSQGSVEIQTQKGSNEHLI